MGIHMSTTSRSVTMLLISAGAAAMTVCAIGSTTAYASGQQPRTGQSTYQPSPDSGKNQASECQFSLDGRTWIPAAKVQQSNLVAGSDRNVRIGVKANGDATCTVSLASYGAQGGTWQTSGKQVFQDFDTVTLTHGAIAALAISVPGPDCFAQIDLYRGNSKHDGIAAPLPEGPNHPVFNNDLIAAWRGGTQKCTASPSPTPSSSASTPAATPSPSAPTPSPSSSASEPTPSESTSTSSAPSPSTSSPGASAPTTPSDNEGPLADTGTSSTTFVATAAALALTAGGIALVATRRRKVMRHH